MKILLIEDDAAIAGMIRRGLEEARYDVDHAPDGVAGLQHARDNRYNLIVLDVMLPKRDGWDVCRELRAARDTTPILMLTARDAVDDRVRGLELGPMIICPSPSTSRLHVARPGNGNRAVKDAPSSFPLPKRTGRRGSLRRQLIAGNIFALALLLAGLGFVIRYTVASFLMASVTRELERSVTESRPPRLPLGRLGFPGDNGPPDGPPPLPGEEELFGRPPFGHRGRGRGPRPPHGDDAFRATDFDLQGRPFMPDETRKLWDKAALADARQGRGRGTRVVVDGEPLQVLSIPYVYRGKIVGVTQAAYPLTDVERALAGLDAALLTLIPLGLLGAGAAGSFLTDRVLRRVRGATRAAEQISARDFSARLPVSGNDEFSELADTFNGLLGRLEGAFQQQERLLEQQRRFTADASHELKTPLTVIKGTASMALAGSETDARARRSLQDIDRAADAMAHLVQDLLLLARSDGGQLGKKQIILPLREVLEQAVGGVPRDSDSSAPIDIKKVDDALCVRGNETELVRLFANLLENARRYTPCQGRITVRARAEGEHVLTCVSDTGSGIAPEHLPHLGERFYRVDTARARPDGGSGLGLSICKSIAQAHGGSLAIESVVGEGTTVRVFLPRPGETII